jgi:hypothetical protein
MHPEPILQYIVNQLRNDVSNDLIVLRELIQSMAGIYPQANLTDEQVSCMGGGPVLRIEALAKETRGSLSVNVQATGIAKTTQKLIAALMKSSLTVPLLVAVAQQRESCIFKVPEHDTHLKYLSNLFDEVFCSFYPTPDSQITNFGANSVRKSSFSILNCLLREYHQRSMPICCPPFTTCARHTRSNRLSHSISSGRCFRNPFM